ncbi:YggT family protein [Caenimonas koreensis DSM 17982]|uniref:YggT family protein n=1 Tax=Caenimonas koreensis DSM 17982 TaxID=1121255 RepID=A0A844B7X1_9BURK|nr:YggT family protein [Caenimonas koreensis]MRD47729.1 YggT family protein [Caenimonas koreensis DSM 17982]
MAYQILSFLLDVIAGLFGGACLLRLYMQYQRIGFNNPIGRFVFALTDWIVLPLRKVLPAIGKVDTSSLVAVYLIELAQFGLLWLLMGRMGGLEMLPVLAIFGVLRLVISGLIGLMILYAVLSWVQADSPMADVIDKLCAPLLRPWRKLIPLVGGIDLSPLAFLVALQIAAIVLGYLQAAVLR